MTILAVEFSSEQHSAAVLNADGELLGRAAETGARGAFGLIEEALRQASREREEIGTIAVGLGPGSYTGIRVAIALAQGWQLGRGVHVLGLSSVECLAAAAEREKNCGQVNIIVDAQRNEFYLGRYEIAPGVWRELEPLRLAPFAEIESMAGRGERILGPEAPKWFPSARNLHPDAAILGRLAAGRRDFVPGEKLEPIYLREVAFKKAPPARVLND
ncbi:MAG TPA: tRNA (adenosine(37)-N6)-threonylcarbamoyltransferase complex dimerization subunit type 1 TsaB [Verrucomicrobiae bacterium]|jgi:tRNA threonylcarbamoyladenosine biosynthesis protein TsaB